MILKILLFCQYAKYSSKLCRACTYYTNSPMCKSVLLNKTTTFAGKLKTNCFSTNNYPNLFVQQRWSVCSTGYCHSDCRELAATQMIIKHGDYSHFPRIDTHLKLIFVEILLQFVHEKTAKLMRIK